MAKKSAKKKPAKKKIRVPVAHRRAFASELRDRLQEVYQPAATRYMDSIYGAQIVFREVEDGFGDTSTEAAYSTGKRLNKKHAEALQVFQDAYVTASNFITE